MTHPPPDPATVSALRVLIDGFIEVRLNAKLDKLTQPDDEQRQVLIDQHHRSTWLADAARRATQIQLATYTVKPIHPDAQGSEPYKPQNKVHDPALVSTYAVAELVDDVVGNAAALDVYKFLKFAHNGESLLARAQRGDSNFHAAIMADTSPEAAQAATEWIANFALAEVSGNPRTHTLAKQLYFPLANGNYHLLAPLFPTALVQEWHNRQVSDRFSDIAKVARKTRDDAKRPEDGKGFRDYPGLAAQMFGGKSGKQNISQLNSERKGAAHLLSALPPVWRSPDLRLPLKVESVFAVPGLLSRQFSGPLKALRGFLVSVNKGPDKQRSILEGRQERGTRVDELVSGIQKWAAEVQLNQPGWSLHADCRLNELERPWLDPYAPKEAEDAVVASAVVTEIELSEEDRFFAYLDDQEHKAEAKALNVDREIARAFARWLDSLLTTKDTPMDSATYREWVNRWLALPVEASHED